MHQYLVTLTLMLSASTSALMAKSTRMLKKQTSWTTQYIGRSLLWTRQWKLRSCPCSSVLQHSRWKLTESAARITKSDLVWKLSRSKTSLFFAMLWVILLLALLLKHTVNRIRHLGTILVGYVTLPKCRWLCESNCWDPPWSCRREDKGRPISDLGIFPI